LLLQTQSHPSALRLHKIRAQAQEVLSVLSLIDIRIACVCISITATNTTFIRNMIMAQENLFELTIPAADLAAVQAAAQTLATLLVPHLISLSASDRRQLLKMGDKSLAFVRKAREYAASNPELVPGFLNLPMFDADLQGVDTLNSLLRTLRPLVDNIEDSLLLGGSEAYQAALAFYRSVRSAAQLGQLNAKTIYDDLSVRFPQGARAKSAKAVEA
jgi:hypothetical protein